VALTPKNPFRLSDASASPKTSSLDFAALITGAVSANVFFICVFVVPVHLIARRGWSCWRSERAEPPQVVIALALRAMACEVIG